MSERGIFTRLLDPKTRELEIAVYNGVIEKGRTVTLSRAKGADITIGTVMRPHTGNAAFFWKIGGRKPRQINTWFGVLQNLFRYEYTDIKCE